MTLEEWDEEVARRALRRNDERAATRTLVLAVLIAILSLLAAASVRGDTPPVSLKTFPPHFLMHNMARDNTAYVTVTVEPHPDNSELHLVWQYAYPGGGGSSTTTLDPSSPKRFMRTLRHITPGRVYLRAVLTRGTKTFATEHVIEVKGGDDE